MVRRIALLALGVVLVAGLVAAAVGRRAPAQAYTVAQVRAGLAQHPAAWAGRTVLMRGVAVESSWVTGPTSGESHFCFGSSRSQSCSLAAPNGATVYLTLIDDSVHPGPMRHIFFFRQPEMAMMTIDLTVQPVTPNPLIALARLLPSLAHFLPMQGLIPGGVSHLYRIRLRSAGSARCGGPLPLTCTDGVLVDAQP
jgi:hypothetical protein